MVTKTAGRITKLSDASIELIRNQEEIIVQSLLDDLQDTDPKVRQAARKDLIALGFQHKEEITATSVISLLLDKAKRGEYGEQAKQVYMEQAGDAKFDQADDVPQLPLENAPPIPTPKPAPPQFVPKRGQVESPAVPPIALGQAPPEPVGPRVFAPSLFDETRPKPKSQVEAVSSDTAKSLLSSFQKSYEDMKRNNGG